MTGQYPDTEQAIREWLADSAPKSAPASLHESLEEVTSQPAARTRPWLRAGRRGGLVPAGRMVAAIALLAIAASTFYLYGSERPTSSGQLTSTPSTSTTPTPRISVATTATETPSPTSPPPSATITQLPGSSWSVVVGAFPELATSTTKGPYQRAVFVLASGGFVAFALQGSTKTRVLTSDDGIAWNEIAALPTTGAVVSDVTESAGILVAVGRVEGGGPALDSAMVWTFHGRTWSTAELSPSDGSTADHVAQGPAGFLVSGTGPGGFRLWSSRDGATWNSVAQSGIPSDVDQPVLLGNATGYVVAQLFQPRVWHSTDGTRWTETYHAPGLSGLSNYYMGPIIRAPDGSYRSFGGVYTGTGIADPVLGDLLIWTSPDSIHWTISAGVKSPGWIQSVAPVGGGFVAAGNQPGSAAASGGNLLGPLGAWTSHDGMSWQPLPGLSSLPYFEVVAVVGDGTHAVIAVVDEQGQLELLVGAALK